MWKAQTRDCSGLAGSGVVEVRAIGKNIISKLVLFPVHLRDQAAQLGSISALELPEFLAQTLPANRVDLIHGNLCLLARAKALQPTTPMGMKLRCQRTNHYCVEVLVHLILAHDNNGADFVNLASASRIEIGEVDPVSRYSMFCH
jgi:hypothetical protein